MELTVSSSQMQAMLKGGRVPPQVNAQVSAKAAEMAREYESVFLQTSFKAMFGEMMNGVGDTGAGSAAWQSMLVEEYANAVSEAGGIGLSDAIARDLMTYQEGDAPAPRPPLANPYEETAR